MTGKLCVVRQDTQPSVFCYRSEKDHGVGHIPAADHLLMDEDVRSFRISSTTRAECVVAWVHTNGNPGTSTTNLEPESLVNIVSELGMLRYLYNGSCGHVQRQMQVHLELWKGTLNGGACTTPNIMKHLVYGNKSIITKRRSSCSVGTMRLRTQYAATTKAMFPHSWDAPTDVVWHYVILRG